MRLYLKKQSAKRSSYADCFHANSLLVDSNNFFIGIIECQFA